jgi:hypothetical protein
MSNLNSLLLYQDKPEYGLLLKLIILIVPGGLLATSVYLLLSGEDVGGLVLLIEVFIVSLIFWCVFPRMYQVYEDHVRIVLGGPFSVKVGFVDIKTIRTTNKLNVSVNFVTKLTNNYVEISKKKGFPIAITPNDFEQFTENANSALSQWKRQTQTEKKGYS